jgi:hypothetical protein
MVLCTNDVLMSWHLCLQMQLHESPKAPSQDLKVEEKMTTRRSSRRQTAASALVEEEVLPADAPLGGLFKHIPADIPAMVPQNSRLPLPSRRAEPGSLPQFTSCRPRGALHTVYIDAPRKKPACSAKTPPQPVRSNPLPLSALKPNHASCAESYGVIMLSRMYSCPSSDAPMLFE